MPLPQKQVRFGALQAGELPSKIPTRIQQWLEDNECVPRLVWRNQQQRHRIASRGVYPLLVDDLPEEHRAEMLHEAKMIGWIVEEDGTISLGDQTLFSQLREEQAYWREQNALQRARAGSTDAALQKVEDFNSQELRNRGVRVDVDMSRTHIPTPSGHARPGTSMGGSVLERLERYEQVEGESAVLE
jgi:hypothetical protein